MKTYIISVIFAGLLLVSAWLVESTSSASVYNPWYDLDDDGDIDIFDVVRMASIYGSEGIPFLSKAALAYDTGWLDISDKQGQQILLAHNLDSTDLILRIRGKVKPNSPPHQKHLDTLPSTAGWNSTIAVGSSSLQRFDSIVQTNDRGYALAGFTIYLGAGSYDCWLVKTDAEGRVEWNQTYGSTGLEASTTVIQTPDGGYAIGGYRQFDDARVQDFWLIKTDSIGMEEWNQSYGYTASNEVARCMIQTSDGGYALAGYKYNHTGATERDFWLVKIDAAGNYMWNRTFGTAERDQAQSVIQTADGGYAIAGDSCQHFWLVRTDVAGNHLWNRTYESTGSEDPHDVVQTSDGGFAIAGRTAYVGGEDMWLVRTDSAGNSLWNRTYDFDSGLDVAYAIAVTRDGGFALGGIAGTWDGGSDFGLVKTDADGRVQWSEVYGESQQASQAFDMIVTNDEGFALVGCRGIYSWLVKTDPMGLTEALEFGLTVTDISDMNITLRRGAIDPYWNYVRVQMWKVKDTP
jgi:hypothetical protein